MDDALAVPTAYHLLSAPFSMAWPSLSPSQSSKNLPNAGFRLTCSRAGGSAPMLRAALYGRYSSSLQHPSSIEDQIALCRQQAGRFGCRVLDDHLYTDAETSGSTAQRDGYQRLLEAARAKAFDAIIVEGQDRLWRNQAEMHAALLRLQFWGIKVFAVSTGADLTDKAGKLIAAVMGWKDEAYLEDLRDKTRRGLVGRVRRGHSPDSVRDRIA
jgi:site-specific DNA recombinase